MGGAGGGGVIGFQSGGDFVLSDKAEISLNGGKALDPGLNNNQPPVRSAGGGGSGGSILIQCGGLPQVLGTIDVRGGQGGLLYEKLLVHVSSIGGNGGAGYVRVEADPAASHSNFPRFLPPASAGNAGLLRKDDHSKVSVGTSLWYNTRSLFPPTYLYYVIEAKVEGLPVIYSDNNNKYPEAKEARTGEPVVFFVQSAAVDPKTNVQIGPNTDWIEGSVEGLNDAANSDKTGNGVRFMLRLDKAATPSTDGAIEVDSIRIYYRG
jgi:hypothetical protein